MDRTLMPSPRDLPPSASPVAPPSAATKSARLRALLASPEVTILMEAHDGLSAKLAEEAGFPALWASGLAISAALGVRDSNEASWTQVLEVLEFMADATRLPILLDGDTGYGNFNNVRRLVTKLEQRNIAGVCLEDKLFPKTNSFIDGERQPLASIDEFCGKIQAAKDTQRDPSFVLVARTEACIAGWGVDEALLRATAYAESGADAILCHSKRRDAAEVVEFASRWKLPVPIVVVPTKYPAEPLSKLAAVGIKNFIFANQSVRTVIAALQRNLRRLRDTESLMSVEEEIAPVEEIFRLQNAHELKLSEQRYLPATSSDTRALVLAASKGNFGELVARKPKTMLQLGGKPILGHQIAAYRREGIREIGVVRGYCKEAVDLSGLRYFDNDDHAQTGELWSLQAARDFLRGDLLIAYGDILFDDYILHNLLRHPGEIKIAVDAARRLRARADSKPDLVVSHGCDRPLSDGTCELREIGTHLPDENVSGEWIGLLAVQGSKTGRLVELLDRLVREEPEVARGADLPLLLNRLVQSGETVSAVHSWGHWCDLDGQRDLCGALHPEVPRSREGMQLDADR